MPLGNSSKESMFGWRDLSHRWRIFVSIALSPAVVLLCMSALALIIVTITLAPPSPAGSAVTGASAVFTVVIAVLSSVAGGVIAQRLDEATGKGILVTRGKSAIRGLKLLLLSVAALETRTRTLLKRLDTDPQIASQALEEVIERCNTLEEEAVNAIEEWQDIIPDADITTQIGMISTLAEQRVLLADQIARLQHELGDTKDRSAQEKEKLETTLREKEAALQKVSRDLRSKEAKLSTSPRVGPSPRPDSILQDQIKKITGSMGSTTIDSIVGKSAMDSLLRKDYTVGSSMIDSILGKSGMDSYMTNSVRCSVCGMSAPKIGSLAMCPSCGSIT